MLLKVSDLNFCVHFLLYCNEGLGQQQKQFKYWNPPTTETQEIELFFATDRFHLIQVLEFWVAVSVNVFH
jgi:hypothetical protein